MKEILQNCYGSFETIKVRQNMPILEYLKEKEKYRFILKQVNHNQFLELQNANQELNGVHYKDLFEEVDQEEFLEYAINPEKGENALAKRRYY